MCTQTLSTPHGSMTLEAPASELVHFVGSRWPMGIREAELHGRPAYGIVFQHGQREAWGVKLQQVECSEEDAQTWMEINSARLALAIPEYLKCDFGGLLVAGAYCRTKKKDFCEPGIALFPVPDLDGRECRGTAQLSHFDDQLGRGSSNMVVKMAERLAAVSKEILPALQPIGIDVRPRLKLGSLRLDFLILQQHVFCLRRLVAESDPLWQYAAKAGFRHLLHMPSFTAGIQDD